MNEIKNLEIRFEEMQKKRSNVNLALTLVTIMFMIGGSSIWTFIFALVTIFMILWSMNLSRNESVILALAEAQRLKKEVKND